MLPLLCFLLFADATALLRQGLLALQSGQVQQAQDNLLEASKLDGKNPYIWSSLAETHRRLGQDAQALNAAQKAEVTAGSDPTVAHALAIFYTQVEQPAKAAALESRFASSPKADGEAWSRVVQLYGRAGDSKSAIDAGQKAWANPKARTAALASDYSMALLQKQSFTEAADVAGQGLALDRDNAQLQLVMGVARYGQRRFEEAIVAFLQVAKTDSSIPQPYLFLGSLLEQAGTHLDEVVAVEDAWAKREPANAKAQLTLAKALLQKDRSSNQARALLNEAIRLDPQDWEGHYQLGVLLENAHDYPAASAEFKKSIEVDANRPLPHFHLARVYDRTGQPNQARSEREIHARLTGNPIPNR